MIGRVGLPHRALATVPAFAPGAPVWIHRCSSRQYLLNCGRELICFSAGADSFFKKNAGRATGDRGWCGEETIDACNPKARHGLASAEFFSRGPHPVPFYHWGARFLADLHRGFGGFVIEANGRSIFHCGDSAYFPGFKEIGERHDVEIALLPIGAYAPPSGREVHMNPEEAVQAFLELG